ncbi:MAG: LytTR family DNA-binding domain-containing protein [Pseudomonadota bacterium]
MNVQDYLRHPQRNAALVAATLVLISCIANALVVWIDLDRAGRPYSVWLPWILEVTSHAAVAVLIPAVAAFDRRFPLAATTWRQHLPVHVAFSVVFSLAHVILFYWLRKVSFALFYEEQSYYWPNWFAEFAYEYLKDFRTYMLALAIIYLYRFVVLRLQGEAGFVPTGETARPDEPTDRFLVKKLGREFLVRVSDIDWIEASGNYVNLHVGARVYPLRGTMASISAKLSANGFARVHRRAIVNLDRIAEMKVFDSGDGEIRLTTDGSVPVSRRFRRELAAQLG